MDLSAALQEETIDATYETLPEVLSSRPVLSLEAVRNIQRGRSWDWVRPILP